MDNQKIKNVMLQAVDNQINDNEPKCTSRTYEELKAYGYSDNEAREMIAAVLLEEMYDVLKFGKEFNEPSYAIKLAEMLINKMSESYDAPVNTQDIKIGRNDPCLCGSGIKFKKCCGN